MLLNDIGKSPTSTFRRINQHLESNYGFKIAEDVSDKDLVAIMETIEGEITDLKIKGDDAKDSPEISKRLLVLEGLKSLREFAMMQFQSPDLDHVVNGLADYVHDCFRLGGTSSQDFDECVNDGMRHYRSSRYRFPDDMIEQRVRQAAMARLNGPAPDPAGQHSPIDPVVSEGPLLGEEEVAEDQVPNRNAAFGFAKRDSARGGHEPSDDQSKAAVALAPKELSLAPMSGDDQVPMIRDKNGRMVPDPFAAQAAARRKGIVMKEHLVKNLRRLLETEVSQAEVMMAAKGFAQELQEMIEKIGRLQNEDLPPVTDQMRETYGTESASAFQTQIYGALQSVMDSLYAAKGQVDDAVSNMASTGQVGAENDMDLDGMDGMDPALDAGAEMDADLDNIAGELDAEDEFGGAEEEEPLGRAMKAESIRHLEKKIMEMKKLVEKARKLKEAQCSMEEDEEEDIEEATRVLGPNGQNIPAKGMPGADAQRAQAAGAVKLNRAVNRAEVSPTNVSKSKERRGVDSSYRSAPGEPGSAHGNYHAVTNRK